MTVKSIHDFYIHWETQNCVWLALLQYSLYEYYEYLCSQLWWSGTKFTITLRYACGSQSFSTFCVGSLNTHSQRASPGVRWSLNMQHDVLYEKNSELREPETFIMANKTHVLSFRGRHCLLLYRQQACQSFAMEGNTISAVQGYLLDK